MPGRVFTPCVRETWRSIQDKFYESKTSSRFPNFDTSNAWQLGHDSPEGIFLGQELLLDFAAWLDQGFMMSLNHQAGMQGTLKD